MLCVTNTVSYVCSNATGTTCIKKTVNLPVISAVTPCTATQLVLLNQSEYAATLSPFNLTLAEGGAISGAVITVWVIGWAVRAAIRTIKDSASPSFDSD